MHRLLDPAPSNVTRLPAGFCTTASWPGNPVTALPSVPKDVVKVVAQVCGTIGGAHHKTENAAENLCQPRSRTCAPETVAAYMIDAKRPVPCLSAFFNGGVVSAHPASARLSVRGRR